MRFSSTTIFALPLIAAAAQQQAPLDQIQEQAMYWYNKISSYLPNPNTYHAAEAAASKAAGKNIEVLTIGNWESTLRSSVKPSSKGPVEWWVLLTGGNKTCYGLCEPVSKSFNESAAIFKLDPTAPHMAYINCDHQPILCNSWAAGPPALYIMEISPPPAPVDVYITGLNASSVSTKTFTNLRTTQTWKKKPKYEGYFHPFDGTVAKLGLAQPFGWILWAFSIIPSWMFMIGVSFASRSLMSRRAAPAPRPRAAAPGAAPGGAAAPRT